MLESLYVDGNRLKDAALRTLAGALAQRPTLVTLDLSRNEAGRGACAGLGALLRVSPVLTTFSAGWARLCGPSLRDVIAGMRAGRALTALDLSWNGFGDPGPCAALGDVLADAACAIARLNLAYNRIQASKGGGGEKGSMMCFLGQFTTEEGKIR